MTWPSRPDASDPHIRAFLDDIADHPDDAGVRLVFADWLAERDDPRAELLRLQAAHIRDEDREQRQDIKQQVKTWLDRYGRDWLGELPPPSNGYSLCLEYDLLEVMSFLAPTFLESPELEGLRQRLREGWIRYFRLNGWNHDLIQTAARQGLLSGPTVLDLLGGRFVDASLSLIGSATQLRVLRVGGISSGVADEGLVNLAGLVGLRELTLWSLHQLTGSGLAHLTPLTGLRHLSIHNGDNVGDEALAAMPAFPLVEVLSLSKCGAVSGAGLERLAGLPALRDLDLSNCTRLTDAAMAPLSRLAGLRKLNLAWCSSITDAGVAHLTGLRHLERLSLCDCTQVTGPGVAHLHGLKNLRWLNLIGCKLKPHETRALRKALPRCEVVRKW